MTALHAGSTRYPFVGRVEPSLEVVIRHHTLGREVSDAGNSDARQSLGVIVTGMFVADLYDLATVIHPAMTAYEVRALGLMTLVAFHGRDRAQFPICRSTAARFTARRLPL